MAWNDFFSTEGNTPSDNKFNYQSEADKVARKRAVANLLIKQSQDSPKGQFFSNGVYTGYAGGATPLSAIAQMLTAYMGTKAQGNADQAQNDLDANSRKAFADQMSHLNDQVDLSPDEAQRNMRQQMVAEADAQQAEEARRQVQPAPAAVQPNPTGTPSPAPAPVSSQPAPTQSVSPKPVVKAAATALQGAGPQTRPIYDPMGNVIGTEDVPAEPAPKTDLKAVVKSLKGDSTVSAADIAALPKELTSPAGGGRGFVNPPVVNRKQRTVAAKALQGLPTIEVAREPVASVNAETSKLMPSIGQEGYDYQSEGQMGPALPAPTKLQSQRAPTQAELLTRLNDLSQTGPMGAKVAEAQLAMLGPKAHEYDMKDGYVFDKRTGEYKKLEGRSASQSETIDTPSGLFYRDGKPVLGADGKQLMGKAAVDQNDKVADTEASYQQSKSDFGVAASRLNNILSNPELIDHAAGGWVNNLKGALPVPTDQSEARSAVKEAASGMVMGAIKSMKTAGVGTGAFNSDAESARLQAALADIDFVHIGPDVLKAKLNSLYAQAQDAQARLEAARNAKVPVAQQTNPQVARTGGRGVMKFD